MGWLVALIEAPFIGFIILMLPYFILMFVALFAVGYSIRGGTRRLVGFISCPILGSLCIGVGWWVAYVGFPENGQSYVSYPIAGWIGIVVGSCCLLFGTPYSLFGQGGLLLKILSIFDRGSGEQSEEMAESLWENIQCIGNLKTGRYHEINCTLIRRINPENMIGFRSAYEAEKSGFTRCTQCHPRILLS